MFWKFLLTIIIGCAAWFGFRQYQRLSEAAKAKELNRNFGQTPQSTGGEVVDLAHCPKCGTYHAQGQNCPN